MHLSTRIHAPAIGAALLTCTAAGAILWKTWPNVTVYAMHQGIPTLYKRERLSEKAPVLDLSRLTCNTVRLVFSRRLVKKLPDRKVFVIGPDANYRITLNGLVQELPLVLCGREDVA